jgi:peptide-methionine (R)-S-oxide reductase
MRAMERVELTDEEWRARLTPEQYAVLRRQATERAFTGTYTDTEDPGVYRCAGCEAELFRSDAKFHSGSGWPSFVEPASLAAVETRMDTSHGMVRVEVVCATCGGHLGHVFDDGPGPTRQRFCINSCALQLEPADDG